MNAQADLPRLVRELRERTGLTQEKFAAKLGVTYPTINRWENGRAKPSPLALKQIEESIIIVRHSMSIFAGPCRITVRLRSGSKQMVISMPFSRLPALSCDVGEEVLNP